MDISIRGRLAIGFGTIFVLVAIGLAISIAQSSRLNRLERQRTEEVAPSKRAINDVIRTYLAESIALRTHALDQTPGAHARFERAVEAARAARTRLETLPLPSVRPLVDDVIALAQALDQHVQQLAELIDGHAPTAQLEAAESRLDGVRARLIDALKRLDDAERAADAVAEDQAAQARARIVDALALVALLVFGFGGVCAVVTTRAVRGPAARLLSAARALARGDYADATALAPADRRRARTHDELRELAAGFADMARALERREAQITASAEVAQRLSASIEPSRIADGALDVLVRWTGLPVGAVYLAANGRLTPVARRAISHELAPIGIDEGIPGQAAANGQTLVVRDIPDDTPFRMHLGVDEVRPRTLVAVPMRFEQQTVGVLVLAGIQPLDAGMLATVEQAAQHLAISLRNALSHVEVQRLARELEQRNVELRAHVEEVQAQNEEIQAQNEEIHAQNEQIQARNEEIQSLSDEVRAQNEALRRHNDTLAETDRQKDELISVASHELRTPLAALSMATQLLVRHCDESIPSTALKKDAERTLRQVAKLSGHVERLLDFSRARMGRLELRRAPTNVATLLRDLVADLGLRAADRKITLELESDALVGEWDKSYLEQVFTNLIENALRYSPNGEDIDVRAFSVDGEVRVSVRDRGIGMTADAMSRLFEPYFRDAEARRITRVGMGIGLYVTRHIVDAHGGRIWAESLPNSGSTFTVALPLARAEQAPVAPRPTNGHASALV